MVYYECRFSHNISAAGDLLCCKENFSAAGYRLKKDAAGQCPYGSACAHMFISGCDGVEFYINACLWKAVQDTMCPCFSSDHLPVMLLVMAVLPAISEELLFRGILYNTYRKAAPLMGVFLSALFFALLHGNFNQIPYAFFLGLVLALMMEATGSIIIPVIMHFLMNGSNVLISYAMKPVFFKEQVMSGLDGFAETESILQSLTAAVGPDGLKVVIAIYAFIALLFAAAVAALIYATFLINRKPVKSLVIPGRSIRQRLSLLDWWVAVFIGLMLVRMILLI